MPKEKRSTQSTRIKQKPKFLKCLSHKPVIKLKLLDM
jgi:hypothetical protein